MKDSFEMINEAQQQASNFFTAFNQSLASQANNSANTYKSIMGIMQTQNQMRNDSLKTDALVRRYAIEGDIMEKQEARNEKKFEFEIEAAKKNDELNDLKLESNRLILQKNQLDFKATERNYQREVAKQTINDALLPDFKAVADGFMDHGNLEMARSSEKLRSVLEARIIAGEDPEKVVEDGKEAMEMIRSQPYEKMPWTPSTEMEMGRIDKGLADRWGKMNNPDIVRSRMNTFSAVLDSPEVSGKFLVENSQYMKPEDLSMATGYRNEYNANLMQIQSLESSINSWNSKIASGKDVDPRKGGAEAGLNDKFHGYITDAQSKLGEKYRYANLLKEGLENRTPLSEIREQFMGKPSPEASRNPLEQAISMDQQSRVFDGKSSPQADAAKKSIEKLKGLSPTVLIDGEPVKVNITSLPEDNPLRRITNYYAGDSVVSDSNSLERLHASIKASIADYTDNDFILMASYLGPPDEKIEVMVPREESYFVGNYESGKTDSRTVIKPKKMTTREYQRELSKMGKADKQESMFQTILNRAK